ncbi:major facilitator superfamily domain-containing protein [Russula brevipes]|nr:major facilitator superfamily domain-containing protein [Russula brevipes]
MFHLRRWPSTSTVGDDARRRRSLLLDSKCEAGYLYPTPSNATSSATHLPNAGIKSQTHAMEKGAVKKYNGLPSPQRLTTVQVLAAHIGAALTLFLATTDATIVSTCLPTIIDEFQGSASQYTWIGVSYLLTQTACQPLYGRISDLTGRKFVLFASILVFALGSLLCGAARVRNCQTRASSW